MKNCSFTIFTNQAYLLLVHIAWVLVEVAHLTHLFAVTFKELHGSFEFDSDPFYGVYTAKLFLITTFWTGVLVPTGALVMMDVGAHWFGCWKSILLCHFRLFLEGEMSHIIVSTLEKLIFSFSNYWINWKLVFPTVG